MGPFRFNRPFSHKALRQASSNVPVTIVSFFGNARRSKLSAISKIRMNDHVEHHFFARPASRTLVGAQDRHGRKGREQFARWTTIAPFFGDARRMRIGAKGKRQVNPVMSNAASFVRLGRRVSRLLSLKGSKEQQLFFFPFFPNVWRGKVRMQTKQNPAWGVGFFRAANDEEQGAHQVMGFLSRHALVS